MRFDEATAVEPLGDGRYRATVHDGWDIWGKANGGYLLAIAARAAAHATGKPDPLTVTAHYLAPAAAGPVTVEVTTHRIGGRHATAGVTVADDERPALVVLATTTDLAGADGPERVDSAPPDLPPPERCVRNEVAHGAPALMDRIELRLHPEDSLQRRSPDGLPRMRGWFRLGPDQPLDTMAVLQASDAFPPTILGSELLTAWVPTVELTTEVRGRPSGEWLACSFTTRFIQGGYLEEDGELWDEQGTLVAQSRQLALLPRPPA